MVEGGWHEVTFTRASALDGRDAGVYSCGPSCKRGRFEGWTLMIFFVLVEGRWVLEIMALKRLVRKTLKLSDKDVDKIDASMYTN